MESTLVPTSSPLEHGAGISRPISEFTNLDQNSPKNIPKMLKKTKTYSISFKLLQRIAPRPPHL